MGGRHRARELRHDAAPGIPIPGPEAHAPTIDRARFAQLTGRVASLDMVRLAASAHRRAIFRRADGFAGARLAP